MILSEFIKQEKQTDTFIMVKIKMNIPAAAVLLYSMSVRYSTPEVHISF